MEGGAGGGRIVGVGGRIDQRKKSFCPRLGRRGKLKEKVIETYT